jgi:hypothetical protein
MNGAMCTMLKLKLSEGDAKMNRFRTFMIILSSFAIVWCGAGAFYRAAQDDIPNSVINLVLCFVNMFWLTLWIHKKAVGK